MAATSTATSDYYRNADGTVTRKLSQHVINYRDPAGNWQPIDTTLVPGAGGRWTEKANSLSVDFAGSASDGTLVSVGFAPGETLSYGLSGAAASIASVQGSTVTYAGVSAGTDLVLSPTATGLRESVVLHSADAANSWTFPLDLKGLAPHQAADGSIQLVDTTGKSVGSIPAGYAYDSKIDPASGERGNTHAIAYRLQTVNGSLQLVVSLDAAWLHDPARVFPVTVDPTVGGTPNSVTTYVESTAADVGDHSMEPTIKIGSPDTGVHDANSFVSFPYYGLDSSGVSVSAATLSLYDIYAASCSALGFGVAAVTQPWTPSQLTTYPGASYGAQIGSASQAVPDACANSGMDLSKGDWINVPLSTSTFNSWSTGGADYGLAIYGSTTDNQHWKVFDSGNTSSSPYLTLTYTGYVLPKVTSQLPGSGIAQPTLTPILTAAGNQDGAITSAPVRFDFQVADASGNKIADSGLVSIAGAPGSANYPVPAGKLAWNKSYYWTVQAYDGTNYSINPVWNAFTTTVPQPVLTSSLSQNTGGHGFNGAIGNYTTSATDAQVASVGPSLDVVRDYNSRDPRITGAFGAAWSSIFDARATEKHDATGALQSVVVTYPDGSEVGYGSNSGGSFSPPEGRFATFKAITGGYTLTDKNDTLYTFNQALGTGVYGITAVADALGRAVNFAWASGQITTISSATSGRALHLTWTTPPGATYPHVISVVTDPVTAGQQSTALTWTYNYNNDQLASVCPPGTTTACTGYTYQGGSPYQTQVLDDGASSLWPLAEPSGTTASDAVIANEGADNATYSNVTLGQSGPPTGGTATSAGFDGTSSLLTLPSLHLATSPSFGFSLWFQTSTPNGVILSASDNPLTATSTHGNFVPAIYVGSDGKLNALFWQNTQPTPIVTSGAVTDGRWHHLVFSSAPNLQTLWLDGVPVGTPQPGWGALGGGLYQPWLLAHTYIGSGLLGSSWPDQPHPNSSTVYATYFKGSIADVAYTARPLTAEDTAGLYGATRSVSLLTKITRPSGKIYAQVSYDASTNTVIQVTDENGGVWKLAAPVVTGSSQVYRSAVLGARPLDYYRLGDSSGASSASDEVHGGTATYNAVTLGVSGPFSDATAATFNGSSSNVQLPSGLVTQVPQSIGVWFNTTKNSEVLVGTMAGSLSATAGFDPELYIGSDGKLAGEAWTGDANTPVFSKSAVNDGKWHFAVLSVQASSQTLYVDGASQATKSGTVNMSGNSNIYVGAGWLGATWPDNADTNKTAAVQYFTGSIAEVAVYGSALTGDQVTAQYTAARNSQGLSPVESVSVTDPGNKVRTERYDLANGFRKISDTDGLGHTTSYGYDTGGFLYTTTDPNGNMTTTGHDVRGNTVSQTTCQNQTANTCSTAYYTYFPDDTTAQPAADPRNDLVQTVRDGRSSSATDSTYLTTYSYDQYGNKTAVTTPPVPGFPSGRTTTITYSNGSSAFPAVDSGNVPTGLPVRTLSPGGAVNSIAYFHNGDVAATTNADGLVTTFTYDNLGRVAAKTVQPSTPVAWWEPTSTTQGTNNTVRDGSGTGNAATASNVTWTSSGASFNGTSSQMTAGAPVVNTAASFTLSAWVNLASIPSNQADVISLAGANQYAAYLQYSTYFNNWTFATTSADVPYSSSAPTYYSAAATGAVATGAWTHLVAVYNATSNTSQLYVNGALAGSSWTPTAWSATKALTIGAGSGQYYFNGQIANVQVYQRALPASDVSALYGSGSSGSAIASQTPNGQVTTYQYDGQDNVIGETDPAVTDRVTGAVHTAVTTSVYGVDGELKSQSIADSTGGDLARTVSSTYNQYDQVDTQTDANQKTTSYTYDGYGNKTGETDADNNQIVWGYDDDGHQKTQTLENYTGSPLNPQTAAPLTEWSKAYDPAGRLASTTDSLGNTTSYTYFDNSLTATITRTDYTGTQSYLIESDTYDAAGNQISKTTNNGATVQTGTVDAADRTASETLDPSGVNRTTTYSYTPDDKVATTTNTDPGGATQTTTATYDPMGNQTSHSVYQDGAGHPTGWWMLNQTTGSTVTDSSGTGNTAQATGATWTGSGASFAAAAGQQIATNGPVLNTASSFTISAWANLSATGAWSDVVTQDGNQASGFFLQYDAADNAWAFSRVATDTANPTPIRAHATTAPTTGTWTHLVGEYNSSTRAMNLYINGTLAGSATDSTPFATNGPLAIGRGRYNGSQADLFNGSIANVQVYPRLLSSGEISTLSSGGRTSGTSASSSKLTTSRQLDVRGLPLTVTDPNGNTSGYTYDEAGHLTVTVSPGIHAESNGGTASLVYPVTLTGYNTFGEPVESQDADGNPTTTTYDANGNKSSQTLPNYTPPGSSSPITATTVWTYDPTGLLRQTIDPLNHATTYLYNQLGDVVQITDRNNKVTQATYDTNGEQRSATDPNGAQTQATYDWMGRKSTSTVLDRYPTTTSVTTYNYTASATDPGGAFLSSVVTQNGATTSYGYDNLGERTQTKDTAGNTTRTTFDLLGRPVTTTLPDNGSSVVQYDASGNVTQTQLKDATGTVLLTTSATYDGIGNRLSATDARQQTTNFLYNADGDLTQEVQPVTATHSITTGFGYDAAGNRTRYTDGRGNNWIYTYNSWNQQQSVIEPTTPTYNTAAQSTFTTAYDADGRPVTQTAPGAVTITAGYDNNGNLTSQTGTGADAATAGRTFGYDGDGRITSTSTTAAGTSGSAGYQAATAETYTYNDRGELLTTSGSAGNSTFTYNADALMTQRADAAGTTSYSYNTADQLYTVTDATTNTIAQYAYNSLDQVRQI